MKYSLVMVLVGIPEEVVWDCGCDQTFGLASLLEKQTEEIEIILVKHKRGFLSPESVEKLRYKTFDKEGGI